MVKRISEPFYCRVATHTVEIVRIEAEIKDSVGGTVVTTGVIHDAVSCNGEPSCGAMFKLPPCPCTN